MKTTIIYFILFLVALNIDVMLMPPWLSHVWEGALACHLVARIQ